MKPTGIFCVILLIFSDFLPVNAQTYSTHIESNNIRAEIQSGGSLFWNGDNDASFQVPKSFSNFPKYSIHSSTLWMGAVDNSGALRMAAQTYRQNGSDFISGPLHPDSLKPIDSITYDYLWQLTRKEVKDHIRDPTFPSDGIVKWPGTFYANGKHHRLAPFIDADSNGIYEPLKGDAPKLTGEEEVLFVFNDYTRHGETNGKPLGVQVVGSAYCFKDSFEWLNNTIFVDYYITNRSGETLKDFYAGVWVDFDLGNYDDDFIGTDTGRNMMYAYNGDNDDEGILGYGLSPPAMGVIVLNQGLNSSIYYNNKFNVKEGNPITPEDYYSLMNGVWLDGSSIMAEGNGTGSTGTPTNFVYTGNACDLQPWSETSGLNTPGDRRMLGGLYLGELKNGETKKIALAYLWSRRFQPGRLGSVCKLQDQADSLKAWYSSTLFPALGVKEYDNTPSITLYPNPANDIIKIETRGITDADINVTVYDLLGKAVLKTSENLFSVKELVKGVYVVRGTVNGIFFNQKIIIQ